MMRRRGVAISGALHELQANATILEGLLSDGMTTFAGFELGFLNCVRLQKAVEMCLVAPVPVEVVVTDRARQRVDDDGILPAWEPNHQTRRLAAEELGGALHRRRQAEPLTGGSDSRRVMDFRLNAYVMWRTT
jgi:hypothetical protein